MSNRSRQLFALLILSVTAGIAVWAVLRFTPKLRQLYSAQRSADPNSASTIDLWDEGIRKVKEDRQEPAGASVEVPTQLRHYPDTHWFLATQIAEVKKFNVATCQDFLEVAAMLQRGELNPIPAATENYILMGVGANADSDAFTKFFDDHSVGLYDEAGLRSEYARMQTAATAAPRTLADLNAELRKLKPRDRAKRDLQKQIAAAQQQLASLREQHARLDQFYGNAATRNQLLADYQQLQTLAKSFGGRSYNLDDANDRQELKTNLLRSLRPQAFEVLKKIARAYHDKFNRPLPVSSLVRPEEYQHDLHKVNRNAVLIDTPPHSTGLAFDIDYRYMSAAEQNFVMSELARMKDEGTIEVIRERNANYHVFVFLDGQRPSDELIAASLEAAGAPPEKEANHAEKLNPKAKPASHKQARRASPRSKTKERSRKRSRR